MRIDGSNSCTHFYKGTIIYQHKGLFYDNPKGKGYPTLYLAQKAKDVWLKKLRQSILDQNPEVFKKPQSC